MRTLPSIQPKRKIMEANEIEDNNSGGPLHPVASAARFLNISYQRMMYAIAKDWVNPIQKEPLLFTESELIRFREERLNSEANS
jgi:hypothetical protein